MNRKKTVFFISFILICSVSSIAQDTIDINVSKHQDSIALYAFKEYMIEIELDTLVNDNCIYKIIYHFAFKNSVKNYVCTDKIEVFFDFENKYKIYDIVVLDTAQKVIVFNGFASFEHIYSEGNFFYYYSGWNYDTKDYNFFFTNKNNFIYQLVYAPYRAYYFVVNKEGSLFITTERHRLFLPANEYLLKFNKVRRYFRAASLVVKKYDYCFFRRLKKKTRQNVHIQINYEK